LKGDKARAIATLATCGGPDAFARHHPSSCQQSVFAFRAVPGTWLAQHWV